MVSTFNWQGAPSKSGAALQNFGRFVKPATDLPVVERKSQVLRNQPRYQQGPAMMEEGATA